MNTEADNEQRRTTVVYNSLVAMGAGGPAAQAIYDLAYFTALSAGAGVGEYGEPVVIRLAGGQVRRFDWPFVQTPREMGIA